MNIAVIFAGGVGSRMRSQDGTPKQFLEIDGKSILIHTLERFEHSNEIEAIVIVMKDGYIEQTKEQINRFGIRKVRRIVVGGETGQESIYHGLIAAKDISGDDDDIVLIHDGVRPFVDDELINVNIQSVKKYGSAISCTRSKETVIEIDEERNINNVIDRSKIWLARAPQSFWLHDILSAHEIVRGQGKNNIIDSCTMMINLGKKLHVVETSAENIKITTPEDFYVATGLILKRKEEKDE